MKNPTRLWARWGIRPDPELVIFTKRLGEPDCEVHVQVVGPFGLDDLTRVESDALGVGFVEVRKDLH